MTLPGFVEPIAGQGIGVRVEPPYTRFVVALVNTLHRYGIRIVVLAASSVAPGLDDDIELVSCNEHAEQDAKVAILWCDNPPQRSAEDRIIVCAGPSCRTLKQLRRLSVRRVETGYGVIYVVSCCGRVELTKIDNNVLAKAELPLELSRTYTAILHMMSEGHSVRVSDAATHVSYVLGVKKGEARKLISELARLGLIKIVEGYVVPVFDKPPT